MNSRIRIVSDIHLGHKASVVDDLKALRPLAEGVDWLIFNGDTLETKYGDIDSSPYNAETQKKRFWQEAENWNCETTLITGNHDPDISDQHSLSIMGGQVFITHGDALFADIAPWSSNVGNLRRFSANIDPDATGSSSQELHDYLQLYKQATLTAHQHDKKYNPTAWGKIKILLHQAWPPSTPFRILKSWREVPDRAASLAQRFGLNPKFVVVGHTHNPGVWKRGETTIINLGSYFPWPGARCVDIASNRLSIRKIKKRENQIEIGKQLATFELEEVAREKIPHKVS
ncbi:metallophosphoesterase [Pelagicoccus mobilis]|uniref:Metallophosphoesterase family protein n=1 Tax=Pelagicoccus mobilis TaxID=415221 RepID=A0A934VT63_9BACT|nr:metallophosphoesterase [Pelagicoccus mobilis]MBK1879383.1 metallophosphoesterase family protein [Pelagicoccus mobilis]